MPGKPWANHPYPSSFTSSRANAGDLRSAGSVTSFLGSVKLKLQSPFQAYAADGGGPGRAATARYRYSPKQGSWRGPGRGPMPSERSQGHVCVHSMSRESSLLVKRVLRLSVLLIIRWFRVPLPGAPLGVSGPRS
jgi:hypothetical protein